jgi:hypothetical protein
MEISSLGEKKCTFSLILGNVGMKIGHKLDYDSIYDNFRTSWATLGIFYLSNSILHVYTNEIITYMKLYSYLYMNL